VAWGALAALIVGWALARAFLVEPAGVEAVKVEIPAPGLDPGLDGLRIVHVSDLHFRRRGAKEEKAAAAVREARPDLVFLTGDYLAPEGDLRALEMFLTELVGGRPAFAVLGNHDRRPDVDVEALIPALESAGAHVLVNDRARVNVRGASIDVIGVDDPHRDRDDLDLALDRPDRPSRSPREGEKGFALLLAHSPDIVLRSRAKEVDLILCGHTHGGQIRLPLVGPLKTNTRVGRKAAAGLASVGGARVYVTRGIGENRLRVRFCCRPEVTVITLRCWG